MKKYAKRMIIILTMLGCNIFFQGCSIEETNRTKVRDLDYVIATEEEVPEELQREIEEKKESDFKCILSFQRDYIEKLLIKDYKFQPFNEIIKQKQSTLLILFLRIHFLQTC